jgi:hypothetical protein
MKWTSNFMEGNALYPDYWSDINIAICPSLPEDVNLDMMNDFGVDISTVMCSNASEEALVFGTATWNTRQSWMKRIGKSY